ncbi:MAG: alanyl-tRNA editing protein [Candidatus Micrarchaeota archaeon]
MHSRRRRQDGNAVAHFKQDAAHRDARANEFGFDAVGMTRKLFWEDAYLRECDAKAASVDGNRVSLDQTIFFAFSGGQASDAGTINGINVVEAIANENDIAYVLAEAPSFKQGDSVKVEIDWNRRFTLMRLHSAIHVASLFFDEEHSEPKIIGSNVDPGKARIDYHYPESVSPLLPALEQKTNSFLAEGHEIKVYAGENNRRIWECASWKMNCGGTHVKNTGEIGKIKLKRKNTGAGKARIELTLVD